MPQSTPNRLSQFSDEELAYHESGHAVAYQLGGGTISRLSVQRADRARVTQVTPAQPPPNPNDPADLRCLVAAMIGGEVAMALLQ